MEKKLKETQKNRLTIVKNDPEDLDGLKTKVPVLADKVQQLLLWSNISAVWSYLMLIIMIVRLFACFHGKQRLLMVVSLGFIFTFLAILFLIAWNDWGRKKNDYKKASLSFEHKEWLSVSNKCHTFSWYLLIYGILLITFSFIFLKDIYNGLTLILKLTAPLSVAAYMIGLYFMVKFKHHLRQLQLFTRQTGDS